MVNMVNYLSIICQLLHSTALRAPCSTQFFPTVQCVFQHTVLRLGVIFLTPLLRVPGICHAARACGGPWGRVVDPDGLLGKAPGAGPCEVVSVAAALRLAGWLLGWLPDRTLPFLAL